MDMIARAMARSLPVLSADPASPAIGQMWLYNATLTDNFNDGLLDSKFRTSVAGNGTVAETSLLTLTASAAATDAAMVALVDPIVRGTTKKTFTHTFQVTSLNGSAVVLALYQSNSPIVVSDPTTINNQRVAWIEFVSDGMYSQSICRNVAGDNTVVGSSTGISLNTTYTAKFILTTAGLQLVISLANGTVFSDSGLIPWSSIYSNSGANNYILFGKLYNDAHQAAMTSSKFTIQQG